MAYEVHIYSGTACITEKSSYKYPVGEKHPILLYLREEENSEYDPIEAEQIVSNLGLDNVEFSRMGKVSHDKATISNNKEYYHNALKSGSSLVLYTDPIK